MRTTTLTLLPVEPIHRYGTQSQATRQEGPFVRGDFADIAFRDFGSVCSDRELPVLSGALDAASDRKYACPRFQNGLS